MEKRYLYVLALLAVVAGFGAHQAQARDGRINFTAESGDAEKPEMMAYGPVTIVE